MNNMNKQDVKNLMVFISVNDGRKANDAAVDAWYDALTSDMPYQAAVDFARKFYADPTKEGKFLETRYLNACWRNMKQDSKPTESAITAEIHALGIDSYMWGSWMYRRQRLLGESMETAKRIAKEFSDRQGDAKR